ncbi:hypothetical protein H9L10_03685 [Phycicoccus endophyticus]|uniref:Uncharacterized protein n=1 Tax=Phycicoccus endophyticus TaxID=1690220 RepID=A0A7G9R3J5_9MICO|nr:hypothetical protein [Phycicoccus endophyticus]NHI19927.1 hypothetical protein [Phycicoccus endophyticus]QNN50170.1 hypothetical protein H9L10_03685 [Phycicoccus endophyticus]GGL27467.1 hypothetical protein GCM10012283_07060 [Phycicoccus endophyticus]
MSLTRRGIAVVCVGVVLAAVFSLAVLAGLLAAFGLTHPTGAFIVLGLLGSTVAVLASLTSNAPSEPAQRDGLLDREGHY